jgi:hypothetical protein
VSAPPVRNQVAPGTSHSSTSSNSARTTSLATPRILSSYTPRRFVTSPAFRGWRSGPLSAAGAARASPTGHPRRGESGGACSRECSVPGRPCRGSVARRTGLMTSPRKMIAGRPGRCEINVLAGTRGPATPTPRPIGLSRSPQITPSGVMPGWCA